MQARPRAPRRRSHDQARVTMSIRLRSTRSATTPASGREEQHRDERGEEQDAEPERRLVGDVGHLGLERDVRDPEARGRRCRTRRTGAGTRGAANARNGRGRSPRCARRRSPMRGPGSPASSSASAGPASRTRSAGHAVRARRCRRRGGSSPTRHGCRRRRGATVPVTKRERSDARNTIGPAQSSAVAPAERHLAAVRVAVALADGVGEVLVAGRGDGVGRDGVDPDRPWSRARARASW